MLQIELAIILDFGEPFVTAMYQLEGNGPLALDCFEIVHSLSTSIQLCCAPNFEATAKKLARVSLSRNLLIVPSQVIILNITLHQV